MIECSMVKVTRNAKCRGNNPKCKCQNSLGIKPGEECLKIKVSQIGNIATAFYCNICMIDVLDSFRKLINFIDTGTVI